MNTCAGGALAAAGLVFGLFGAQAIAQSAGTADGHVAAAKVVEECARANLLRLK